MKAQLLIAVCLIGASCSCTWNGQSPSSNDIWLVDNSDTLITVTELTSDHVFSTLPLEQDEKCGATVTFALISDRRYTETFTERIAAHSDASINEYDRPDEIAAFRKEIEKDIEKIRMGNKPLKQSYVFHGIFTSLEQLSQQKDAGIRRLVVLSDLAENQPGFSVFRKNDLKILTTQPEKLTQQLDAEYPDLQSLEGIEVYFIHREEMGTTDDIFHTVSSFLKAYLEAKSAEVTVGGSLEIL